MPKAVISKALLPSKAKIVSKAILDVVNKAISTPNNVFNKAIVEPNNIVDKAIVAPNIALLVPTAAASYGLLSCANIPIIASYNKGLSLVIEPSYLFSFKRLFIDFLVRILYRVLRIFSLSASIASRIV